MIFLGKTTYEEEELLDVDATDSLLRVAERRNDGRAHDDSEETTEMPRSR